MSLTIYLKKFRQYVDTVEHFGQRPGETTNDIEETHKLKNKDMKTATDDELSSAKKFVNERWYVILFVRHANVFKYGQLIKDLENTYTRGSNEYPETMDKAYAYLLNYKAPSIHHQVGDDEGGIAYLTEQSIRRTGRENRKTGIWGEDGRSGSSSDTDVIKAGHKTSEDRTPYPYSPEYAVAFSSNVTSRSIGMDSCSSVNIFSNHEMLTGIYRVPKSHWIQIVTVGKEVVYLKHKGYFGKYPELVWYYPQGAASILSLHNVKNITELQWIQMMMIISMYTSTMGTRYDLDLHAKEYTSWMVT